jgi:GTP-binding protein EngB required for normal cell division
MYLFRATEMDIAFVGLQNAGKTSLLRVLAVCILLAIDSVFMQLMLP